MMSKRMRMVLYAMTGALLISGGMAAAIRYSMTAEKHQLRAEAQNRADFFANPFRLGQAAGACEAVGRLDSNAYDGAYGVLAGDTTMRAMLASTEFRALVQTSPADYLRGVASGQAQGNEGLDRSKTKVWSICTEGHRFLTEWMTDIVLGHDHARQLASDDATLGPAQRP